MMNNNFGEGPSDFVEVDPTGRYGRYKEILGKGASKIVYRAFDEYEGIEVAWNQVKLYDFLQSPEDLERLNCEIHLLKTLKHDNIMKYYTSWVDIAKRNINFVTEMFTSGTLKQYREKHKRVNIRAVKNWCRQILKGLLYLHSLDPPVIHRDLKCDNIFVNGNQGEVKIGDLGLAAILRKSHVAHCVGTPEFMAPEVYKEEYNELVDIYSFGMCILEMVTFEYPYSECTHPAQIYKKVISGEKPDALYKVKDPEVHQFIDKCLATVSVRLSARELLDDPFLKVDCESDLRSVGSWNEGDNKLPFPREPCTDLDHEGNSCGNGSLYEYLKEVNFGSNGECNSTKNGGIELFEYCNDDHGEHSINFGITMKGKREDGSIILRLRISDGEERIRNIYFPFDIENDTALSVATEMVAELDITDQDVTNIADMIDGEIISLVPGWNPGPGIVETPRFSKVSCCQSCASKHSSTGSFLNFLSNTSVSQELKILQCSGNGCAAMHGRFEEITYQIESPRKNTLKSVNTPSISNQVMNRFNPSEILERLSHESLEQSTVGSEESCPDDLSEIEKVDQIISTKGKIQQKEMGKAGSIFRRKLVKPFADLSIKAVSCFSNDLSEKYNREIQQEMRWVRTKYQMEMRGITDQQMRFVPNSPLRNRVINGVSPFSISNPFQVEIISKSYSTKRKSSLKPPRKSGPVGGPYAKGMSTANNMYIGPLATNTLYRSTSLPVDAFGL